MTRIGGIRVLDDTGAVIGRVDPSDMAEINRALEEKSTLTTSQLIGKIKAKNIKTILLEDVIINNTETMVGHGAGVVPSWYTYHVRLTNRTIFETKRMDSRFIYLAASSAGTTIDIRIEV